MIPSESYIQDILDTVSITPHPDWKEKGCNQARLGEAENYWGIRQEVLRSMHEHHWTLERMEEEFDTRRAAYDNGYQSVMFKSIKIIPLKQ